MSHFELGKVTWQVLLGDQKCDSLSLHALICVGTMQKN